ncbi:uncharacterized protein LOC132623363 [Lycium barbarum]|uniref:uncharacterized protein LOC132623363 n=1 Tax=Lycium barbarum TaxID=112863 RepID=UPI00293F0194|nr:uncharacterized protein LOC132623363 [Lycium barbarum]
MYDCLGNNIQWRSSFNLPGGRTAHSRFEIPLQTNESSMTNMSKQSGAAKLIRKAKLLIWDEVPMAKRQTIETVDRSFRDIMDIDKPFAGKVMVFGGDFRQVLPVVPKSTRAETVNASLVNSYLWPLMGKIQFTRNMRARTDPTFSDFLLRVGNGEQPTIRDNLIRLPEQLTVKYGSDGNAEQSLIIKISPSLQENASAAKYVTERGILASRNEHVDKLNENLITMLPGESKTSLVLTLQMMTPTTIIKKNNINTLTPNGLPTHRCSDK